MLGKGFFPHQTDLRNIVSVAIQISNNSDFKLKSIRRDGDGHFMLIKGIIHQDDVSILNIYAPNIKAPTYEKKLYLISKHTSNPTH